MGLNTRGQLEEGMFMKNEQGNIVRIKELFHEMVIFDEEGTEHVLPKDMFAQYVQQEGYKELTVKKQQDLKEVVESKKSIKDIINSLCEATTPVSKIKMMGKGDSDKQLN